MSTTEDPTATISARVPQGMKGELDALAKSTGRNRNALVQEALRRFIDTERWQIALIEERVKEADAGKFASDEEMNELWAEFGLEPEQERAAS
ncbi:MAG TPA: ribbon-helix-helix domain-containing protein [Chloroflexota bacterium]|nr:ribbon-helix-helix domain-containing protein [Chloroflexota bacterium]